MLCPKCNKSMIENTISKFHWCPECRVTCITQAEFVRSDILNAKKWGSTKDTSHREIMAELIMRRLDELEETIKRYELPCMRERDD